MKWALLVTAAIAASSAYAGLIVRTVPALDEFGLITLAVLVGTVGARAIKHFRGRRKTDE